MRVIIDKNNTVELVSSKDAGTKLMLNDEVLFTDNKSGYELDPLIYKDGSKFVFILTKPSVVSLSKRYGLENIKKGRMPLTYVYYDAESGEKLVIDVGESLYKRIKDGISNLSVSVDSISVNSIPLAISNDHLILVTEMEARLKDKEEKVLHSVSMVDLKSGEVCMGQFKENIPHLFAFSTSYIGMKIILNGLLEGEGSEISLEKLGVHSIFEETSKSYNEVVRTVMSKSTDKLALLVPSDFAYVEKDTAVVGYIFKPQLEADYYVLSATALYKDETEHTIEVKGDLEAVLVVLEGASQSFTKKVDHDEEITFAY